MKKVGRERIISLIGARSPVRTLPHDDHEKRDEQAVDTTKDSKRPAEADLVDHRGDDGGGGGTEGALHEVVGSEGGTGLVEEDVNNQDLDGVVDADDADTEEEDERRTIRKISSAS